MKFTKHLVSGAAALALAGTLGLAFAQSNVPGATTSQGDKQSADTKQRMTTQGTTGAMGTTNSGTMGTTNNSTMTQQGATGTTGTTGTMNNGSNATLSNDSTTGNRNTTGMSNNRRMNADGTTTELAARADRG